MHFGLGAALVGLGALTFAALQGAWVALLTAVRGVSRGDGASCPSESCLERFEGSLRHQVRLEVVVGVESA